VALCDGAVLTLTPTSLSRLVPSANLQPATRTPHRTPRFVSTLNPPLAHPGSPAAVVQPRPRPRPPLSGDGGDVILCRHELPLSY